MTNMALVSIRNRNRLASRPHLVPWRAIQPWDSPQSVAIYPATMVPCACRLLALLVTLRHGNSFVTRSWGIDPARRRIAPSLIHLGLLDDDLLSAGHVSIDNQDDDSEPQISQFQSVHELSAVNKRKRQNDTAINISEPTENVDENPLMQVAIKAASALLPKRKRQRNSHSFPVNTEGFSGGLEKLGTSLQTLIGRATHWKEETDQDDAANSPSSHDTALDELLASLREGTDQGRLEDKASFAEIFGLMNEYGHMLESTWTKFMGSIGPNVRVSPVALWYYLEREDERKNPSWKRRAHRYCATAGGENLNDLNHVLGLAQLTYLNTADEVKQGLAKDGYELLYIDLVSEPGRPAHFLAVQTEPDVTLADDELAVVIGIRGTKTVADTITDLLCDAVDYRGGRAHGFLVNSAQYLAEKHKRLLNELAEKSVQSRIVLTLTGHSLGAGVASIAAIEFNDNEFIEAYVYGFGTPPAMSLDLAKETNSFITTVVSDADVIPRLSSVSIANLILSVGSFDWREYAKRDMDHALAELGLRQPIIFNQQLVTLISNSTSKLLDSQAAAIPFGTEPQLMTVELFPPGRCVHFYRDGKGLSASVVPNDFFQEIDVSRSMIPGEFGHGMDIQ